MEILDILKIQKINIDLNKDILFIKNSLIDKEIILKDNLNKIIELFLEEIFVVMYRYISFKESNTYRLINIKFNKIVIIKIYLVNNTNIEFQILIKDIQGNNLVEYNFNEFQKKNFRCFTFKDLQDQYFDLDLVESIDFILEKLKEINKGE